MIPIRPMLVVSGKAFSSKEWIFEPKIDGARCIAYISNNTVELKNRRMRSISYRYPEIIRALKQAAGIVYLTEKRLYSSMVCQVFPLRRCESNKSTELESIIFRRICLPATLFSIYFIWDGKA